MTRAGKLYWRLYPVLSVLLRLFFPIKTAYFENIPDGAVMICPNHTSWLDALFIPIAFGRRNHLHIVAKKELFRVPLLAGFMRKLEMIGVDRAVSDVSAIREILGFLKRNEKVVIFPEGTRVSAADAVAAKRGAIWLSERAGAPLLPVYIPAKKRLFRKNTVVIGTPYVIPKASGKRAAEDYSELADGLMNSIRALGENA